AAPSQVTAFQRLRVGHAVVGLVVGAGAVLVEQVVVEIVGEHIAQIIREELHGVDELDLLLLLFSVDLGGSGFLVLLGLVPAPARGQQHGSSETAGDGGQGLDGRGHGGRSFLRFGAPTPYRPAGSRFLGGSAGARGRRCTGLWALGVNRFRNRLRSGS